MQIKCKDLIKELRDKGKVIEVKINTDRYIICRGLTFPFLTGNSVMNGNLMVLGNCYSNKLQDLCIGEWFTPSGLRQILDKIKSWHCDKKSDDSILNIKVVPAIDVVNLISTDFIIKKLKDQIEKDLEFMDVDIPKDATENDVADIFKKENIILKKQYVDMFKPYQHVMRASTFKEIMCLIEEIL